MKSMVRITSLVLLLVVLLSQSARAALTIEITQGVESALPIAVVPFGWQGREPEAPLDVAAVVAADLQRSGLFSPLPRDDFLARPSEGSQVRFQNWRLLGVSNLVVGKVKAAAAGFTVQFQLYDVFKGVQLAGYSIRAAGDELRYIAHQISDIIFETLTGVPGAFATRIAYVTVAYDSNSKPDYTLFVADADGFNPRPVLSSKWPVLSPAWSPDGKQLAYVSLEHRKSEIYIQELLTGKRTRLTSFPGLNGAPAWSPDGKQLALVLSKDGNPDIYLMNIRTHRLRRLTESFAIDTEPVWWPDSQSLVFTSDRGGQPQLYRISVHGGQVERLTYEGKYNARAAVSPDGKWLAMVHAEKGQYRIAVMDIASGGLQVLTDGGLDESPSFAPNGSMIIYATAARSKGVLAAVSIDGRVHQRLSIREGDAREPAWSPFRQ